MVDLPTATLASSTPKPATRRGRALVAVRVPTWTSAPARPRGSTLASTFRGASADPIRSGANHLGMVTPLRHDSPPLLGATVKPSFDVSQPHQGGGRDGKRFRLYKRFRPDKADWEDGPLSCGDLAVTAPCRGAAR